MPPSCWCAFGARPSQLQPASRALAAIAQLLWIMLCTASDEGLHEKRV